MSCQTRRRSVDEAQEAHLVFARQPALSQEPDDDVHGNAVADAPTLKRTHVEAVWPPLARRRVEVDDADANAGTRKRPVGVGVRVLSQTSAFASQASQSSAPSPAAPVQERRRVVRFADEQHCRGAAESSAGGSESLSAFCEFRELTVGDINAPSLHELPELPGWTTYADGKAWPWQIDFAYDVNQFAATVTLGLGDVMVGVGVNVRRRDQRQAGAAAAERAAAADPDEQNLRLAADLYTQYTGLEVS
jgi:hypothetical protein